LIFISQLTTQQPVSKTQCQTIIQEYHTFLASTVKFLHEVQERQMYWQWKSDSGVFDGVAWLQGLWASRKAVSHLPPFVKLLSFSTSRVPYSPSAALLHLALDFSSIIF
jgi:hypothetical protein